MSCYNTNASGDNSSNGSWNNVTAKTSGTALSRAVEVAKYLIANGGLTKIQASAVVGVYIDENHCDPHSYMSEEKKGKGAKGTSGFGYGAGIASWTHIQFKNVCLKQAGFAEYTPIESLSLEQQCKMVVGMVNGNQKRYFDALKRCNNIEDASATCVIITGGVGHSKNWKTHPTPQEAQNMSEYYRKANDAKYGKSEHHGNAYGRRLSYAKQVLARLG